MADDVLRCGNSDCENLGTKKCSRCGSVAYCSAGCQRKAWATHKLECQRADSTENDVRELAKAGKLYSAKELLRGLRPPNKKLEADIDEQISWGISSEIVNGLIRLEPVGEMGVGYVAAKDIEQGAALMFDTAFVAVASEDPKPMHERMQEKIARRLTGDARRRSSKTDTQADFFYNSILKLPLKGMIPRDSFVCESLAEEKVEQLMTFSIIEGCHLYCTEEPYFGLFCAAAFFNHSCAPNAEIESKRSCLVVRASEKITAGSEVFISYLPVELLKRGYEDRRNRLEGGRGFLCRCQCCLEEATGEAEHRKEENDAMEEKPIDFASLQPLGKLGNDSELLQRL